MARAQPAPPQTLAQDFAGNACEPIKPDTSMAKLGDLSKFGSLGESVASSAATTCDWPGGGTDGRRQVSQAACSDASSWEELGVELTRDEILSAVRSVVKNSVHAASVMDPTDPDQRLLAVSEPLQELTGFHESELLQASARLLTAGCEDEIDPGVQAAMRNAHLTGSPLLAQAVNRNKQGWLFWNTMYIRGLIVAVDPVSEEPLWLVLTTYSGSEGPSDEDEEDSGPPATPCAGCGAPARTSAPRSRARSAGLPRRRRRGLLRPGQRPVHRPPVAALVLSVPRRSASSARSPRLPPGRVRGGRSAATPPRTAAAWAAASAFQGR
ncbi:unnamed protein product [Prorocentrum cordatum]|uniref:PAS domain-containing protein n=1 Tax=Prorocentrum cordatum TaxID=2364126 RepID=A0ABN9QUU4_9DINO|nr:unnamed protein product [Polarella glacialis]